jgi:chromosome segregation ATPase
MFIHTTCGKGTNIGQVDERNLKHEINGKRAKIDGLTKKIKAEEERLERQNGGASSKLVEDQKTAETKKEQLISEIKSLESEIAGLLGRNASLDSPLKESQSAQGVKRNEISETGDTLRNLQKADSSELGAFSRGTPDLVRAIESERGWREKPVGPIGRYVTLKDQSWMHIVEKFFGSTLNGFIVTNYSDADKLKQLMSRFNW